MGYRALYRAWRSETFADVVGQAPIITTLIHQIETGRVAHAYLFCGSRGTGKTSTAKIFARAINCAHPVNGEACGACEACVELKRENNMDVIEIDAASNNGVDEIRSLRDKIVYPPSVGRYKVYIIDEVHMLSSGAFNALLKTLEEPPSHAVFILATTEPQKLPATILSRCQRFDFKRIPAKLIVGRLEQVIAGEGASADSDALLDIARAAEGGMRDALSLLDMCLSYGAGHITSQLVHEVLGASDRSFLFDFAGALIAGDAARALTMVNQLIANGRDPAVFAREVTAHFRALLVSQIVKKDLDDLLEVAAEDAARYREQASSAAREALMRRMELFMSAESDMKWAAQPRSVIELCSVNACHPERERGDGALLERIARLEEALKKGVVVQAQEGPTASASPKDKPKEGPKEMPKAAKAQAAKAGPPDAEKWQKALTILQEKEKSLYPICRDLIFKGEADGVAVTELPKARLMYKQMLDKDTFRGKVDQALSEAFQKPVVLRVALEGTSAAPAVAPPKGRETLFEANQVFGRENLVILDE